MKRRNSISILDRIFKVVFNERIERIHISTYEDKIRKLEREKLELQKALSFASYDPLTGVLTRVEFEKRVARSFSLFKRDYCRHFSLAFIDINNFKYINDTYGHDAGDNVIIEIAKFLKENLRSSDIIGRLSSGADEFFILLEEDDLEKGKQAIRNIESALKQSSISTGNEEIKVSFSSGVVSTSEVDDFGGVKELIKEADRRMYENKEKYRLLNNLQ